MSDHRRQLIHEGRDKQSPRTLLTIRREILPGERKEDHPDQVWLECEKVNVHRSLTAENRA